MQPFVHSVFFVVVSVIATLLVAGLSGIITMLLMDQQPGPLLTGNEPEAESSGTRVQNRRASTAQPGLPTALRVSH